MKIGVISNGNATLALWKVLTKYDNEYLVYHDQLHFPFGERDFLFVVEEIKKAVWFLVGQGAEAVIVDPIYEVAVRSEMLLPIFQTYLSEYAFLHSLVGKIWLLTDFGSCDAVQGLVADFAKAYHPTESQMNIKKFSFPFQYRVKAAKAWSAGIADLGVHNPYLIRTLKNDLRYFKDANVDTLVPMHYHYFRMQRTIKGFFNFHQTRFHDLGVVEECFRKLIEQKESSPYGVQVWTNQSPHFLLREKELVWLLERGKRVKMQVERI